jgi:hypothetical protein
MAADVPASWAPRVMPVNDACVKVARIKGTPLAWP